MRRYRPCSAILRLVSVMYRQLDLSTNHMKSRASEKMPDFWVHKCVGPGIYVVGSIGKCPVREIEAAPTSGMRHLPPTPGPTF